MDIFNTIENNVTAEIEEKRSRFIANIFYVENTTEAEEKIKQMKKKYYDARHNCYAYIINDKVVIKKSSDDGEPSGTAGSPILNVLEKNNLCNVLVVVTRYFGGILLGAGGLVRAYTQATIESVKEANIVKQELGFVLELEVSYQELDKVKYYLNKQNIKILNFEYKENVKCEIEVSKEEKNKIIEDINKKTINVLKYNVKNEKYIRK